MRDLPPKINEASSRKVLFRGIDQLLDVIRHVPQIFAVDVTVDVNHRSDIVMIDDREGVTAGNRGHIGQNLTLAGTAQDGQIPQSVERIHVSLRHLSVDLIADPVCRIDPKVQGVLLRSGQRTENSVCYGLRVNAKDRCLRPVHRDVQLGRIVWFLDPKIHGPGNLTNLVHQIICELEVSLLIRPDDLNIDGGRQSKVKNLRDYIGRWEPKTDSDKIVWHAAPDRLDEFIGRVVILVERNQNVAVRGTHRSSIIVRGVNAAIGNPEVIDNPLQLVGGNNLADHLFDLIHRASCFFDAGPGFHPDVHIESSGIDRREEILPEKREQNHGEHRKAKDHRHQLASISEAETQEIAIAFPEFIKSIFKPVVETGEPGKKRKCLPSWGLGLTALSCLLIQYMAKVGTSVRDRM